MMRSLPFEYAVRNLGRRPLRTILTAGSSAMVAALLVAVAAFVRGLESTFSGAARSDVAIVMSRASEGDIVRSAISPTVVAHIQGLKGVRAASSEVHLGATMFVNGEPYPGFLRGVTDAAYEVHDAVQLVEGKLPGPGEVMVGALAASQMGAPEEELAVGGTLELEGQTLRIAGRFAAPGTTLEAEVWTPLAPLRGIIQRDDDSVVFAALESDKLAALEVFATKRQDLQLTVQSASAYYETLTAYFRPIQTLAWVLAVMIAAASLCSGANTLNASVTDRTRELATLRALGYSGGAIVRSLAQESVLVAMAGGLFGILLARFALEEAAFSLAMSAFSLQIDAISITVGIAGVFLLGLLGAAPAAWRVLRQPVVIGLNEG